VPHKQVYEKMTREFNVSKELETPEVKAFEKRMTENYGRSMRLGDVPLKNFVDTTTGLLETKIANLFMKGATDAAGFWSDLINVVQMTSPKQDIPVISPRDFKVHKGKVPRAGNVQSGGKFTKVSLDTTDDDLIRYIYLQIDEEDIKLRNFNVIERATMAAGQKYAKNILNDVTAHYDSISGKTQALGADKRFVALFKLFDLIAQDGFEATAVFFESGDFVKAITEETTGGTMPWLMQLQNGTPLGDNFGRGAGLNGLVGYLLNRIPVYSIANEGGAGASEIFAIDVPAAAVFGFAPGGQIALKQEIKTMLDLVEAKIASKYDIKSPTANTSAVGVVTGASA
jgi:hypothetical protein